MSEKGVGKKIEREIVYAMENYRGFSSACRFCRPAGCDLRKTSQRPLGSVAGWRRAAWIAGGIDENQPAAALPKPVAGMAGIDAASFAMAGFRTGGVREWPDSGLECL